MRPIPRAIHLLLAMTWCITPLLAQPGIHGPARGCTGPSSSVGSSGSGPASPELSSIAENSTSPASCSCCCPPSECGCCPPVAEAPRTRGTPRSTDASASEAKNEPSAPLLRCLCADPQPPVLPPSTETCHFPTILARLATVIVGFEDVPPAPRSTPRTEARSPRPMTIAVHPPPGRAPPR